MIVWGLTSCKLVGGSCPSLRDRELHSVLSGEICSDSIDRADHRAEKLFGAGT